ncbi:FUSC family protein [Aquihabitans daechungensis]|uniref:FUSC family protein n=1 Tax=Aquihabitans daechungensis TaxID=1052257 RepID=UPI003BA27F03
MLTIFFAAIGAVVLAQRSRLGAIAMTLGLPMIGIGLSFPEVRTAAGLAAVMIGGAIYACLVSLAWPERPPPPDPAGQPAPPTRSYGIRLGAAGATAAAIGFAFDFDHVGWACAAALLVMRPSAEMQQLRSVGRIVSVAAGAAVAIGVVRLEPADVWFSVAVLVTIATVAGTHRSRWYITPAFTTFLVFVLLLYAAPDQATARFGERMGETVLGVALAYLYGLLIPHLRARIADRKVGPPSSGP